MKAKIRPIATESGTRYAIFWAGVQQQDFPSVTDAQMFCIDNHIPFEPWE